MGGSTKKISTTPKETQQLRQPLVNWLGGTQTPSQVAGRARPQGGLGGMFTNAANRVAGGQPQNGGPQPQSSSPFDRIFAQMPPEMQQLNIQRADPIGQQDRGQFARDVNAQQVQYDGSGVSMVDPNQLPGIPGMGGMDPFQRGQIRDVSGVGVSSRDTQSVDQLGGANSAFFQNMMAQLQPSFTNQRNLGLAAAKEGLGNLTGSGVGNILGSAINRSLGDEQARLADYATQGMGLEMNRQQGDANRAMQASAASAANQMQASLANQGMDSQFLSHLLGQGQLGQQGAIANQENYLRALQGNQGTQLDMSRLGLQGQGMNQDASLRAGMANQGADMQYGNNDLQRMIQNQQMYGQQSGQQFQGDLQRQLAQYQMGGNLADSNAARYAALLGNQASLGVTPDTIVKKGGIGSILGPLGGIAGTVLGGPLGGMIGGKIGGMFGGGGGGAVAPGYQPGGAGWGGGFGGSAPAPGGVSQLPFGGFQNNWRQNWP